MPWSPRSAAVLKMVVLLIVVSTTAALGAPRIAGRTPRGEPAPAGFRIAGELARPLHPGTSQPLALTLVNPHRWSLTVRRLSVAVSVDPADERAGCARTTHFRQTAIPKRFLPIRLPPESRRTLRQLGITVPPRIAMLNLPFDQVACRGVRLRLRFAGLSVRAGRPTAR